MALTENIFLVKNNSRAPAQQWKENEMNKHDCRIRDLEILENYDGFFFVKLNSLLSMDDKIYPIEYCPVCGEKAKKSHIENIKLYPRTEKQSCDKKSSENKASDS